MPHPALNAALAVAASAVIASTPLAAAPYQVSLPTVESGSIIQFGDRADAPVGTADYRKRRYDSRYYRGGRDGGRYDRYDEPVYRDTRVWRGDDGRYRCRKKDGTTGLLIGGAAGALIGNEVAGRGGDRTLGALLGGVTGALLGREIDRSDSRCR